MVKITFLRPCLADGAALTAAMKEANAPAKPPGHQAHHILPEKLYSDPELTGLIGSNPHTADNGIHLPEDKAKHDAAVAAGQTTGKTLHMGRHDRYTKMVKGRLMDIKNSGLPPCKQAEKVTALQGELRSQLTDGTLEYDHKRSNGQTVRVKGLNCRGVVA